MEVLTLKCHSCDQSNFKNYVAYLKPGDLFGSYMNMHISIYIYIIYSKLNATTYSFSLFAIHEDWGGE